MPFLWSRRLREDMRQELKKINKKSVITDNDIDSIIFLVEREIIKQEGEQDAKVSI